jgi:hypothetical protein
MPGFSGLVRKNYCVDVKIEVDGEEFRKELLVPSQSTCEKIYDYIQKKHRPFEIGMGIFFSTLAAASFISPFVILSLVEVGVIGASIGLAPASIGLIFTAWITTCVAGGCFEGPLDRTLFTKHHEIAKFLKDTDFTVEDFEGAVWVHQNYSSKLDVKTEEFKKRFRLQEYRCLLDFDKDGFKDFLLRNAKMSPDKYEEVQNDLYSEELRGLTTFDHKDYDQKFFDAFIALNPLKKLAPVPSAPPSDAMEDPTSRGLYPVIAVRA